jgi:tRNA(fMet)-specific endonuclease VapC
MTTYILDTNIISLLLRNSDSVRAQLDKALTPENVILGCPVVWYEVRRGLLARDARQQIQIFDIVFAAFDWQEYRQTDWKLATELWSQRRAQGHPIGDADLLIAAFARNREAVLVTDNTKDFVDLGVDTENWASSET